jgi:hypothetical protein
MAMTKAEKAALEAAMTDAALRWPAFERPSPMTREEIASADKVTFTPRDASVVRSRTVVIAWFFNAYTGEVTRGWIDGHVFQSNDPHLIGIGASRFEGAAAYRTEKDAWRAMRWAACEAAAKKLRAIDLKEPTQ